MVAAGLTGDLDTAERLGAELGDVDWEDTWLFANALFVLVVQRKFADDTDREVIREFVRELRRGYRSAQSLLPPLVAEGLIRSVLGEEELFDEFPRDEAIPVQAAIINKIVVDAGMSPADVDRLLDEAETMADRWSGQR